MLVYAPEAVITARVAGFYGLVEEFLQRAGDTLVFLIEICPTPTTQTLIRSFALLTTRAARFTAIISLIEILSDLTNQAFVIFQSTFLVRARCATTFLTSSQFCALETVLSTGETPFHVLVVKPRPIALYTFLDLGKTHISSFALPTGILIITVLTVLCATTTAFNLRIIELSIPTPYTLICRSETTLVITLFTRLAIEAFEAISAAIIALFVSIEGFNGTSDALV